MKRSSRIELDRTDLRILDALQRDGSLSAAELAERVGLAVTTCWRRVKRLEDARVIRGRVALLDRELLGLDLLCFVQISVQRHHRDHIVAFEEAVRAMPEVLDCHHMTGEFDFLLKIVVANRKALETLLVERLSTLPGVTRLQTSVVLSEVKHVTEIPIE